MHRSISKIRESWQSLLGWLSCAAWISASVPPQPRLDPASGEIQRGVPSHPHISHCRCEIERFSDPDFSVLKAPHLRSSGWQKGVSKHSVSARQVTSSGSTNVKWSWDTPEHFCFWECSAIFLSKICRGYHKARPRIIAPYTITLKVAKIQWREPYCDITIHLFRSKDRTITFPDHIPCVGK